MIYLYNKCINFVSFDYGTMLLDIKC